MELYRIKTISLAKPGPLDFNITSTWRSTWDLTLDNDRKISVETNRAQIDGVVPVAGDWIYFIGSDPKIFQLYQVKELRGDSVLLSNGECVSASDCWHGSGIPTVGDYLMRKTDGYHVVRKMQFEAEKSLNATLLEAVKAKEKCEVN